MEDEIVTTKPGPCQGKQVQGKLCVRRKGAEKTRSQLNHSFTLILTSLKTT